MCPDRREHEGCEHSQSQVRLLSQGPLRAVAAGGRHHQDPLQERPQRMVERRSVWPGKWFHSFTCEKENRSMSISQVCCSRSQVGLFPANYVEEDYSEYCWCGSYCEDLVQWCVAVLMLHIIWVWGRWKLVHSALTQTVSVSERCRYTNHVNKTLF